MARSCSAQPKPSRLKRRNAVSVADSTPSSGQKVLNSTYRRTLRLGWIILISAFVALLAPAANDFIAALCIGYALGALVGFWALRHTAHFMRFNPHR